MKDHVTEARTIDVANSTLPRSQLQRTRTSILNQSRNFSAFDIMRIWSLLTSIALLASTALSVEIVCTFVTNALTLPIFVDQEMS